MEPALSLPPTAFELVTENRRLAELAEGWRAAEVVALDTEFVRRNSFYQRPGLLQLAGSAGTVLLDPLAITDWGPLKEVLTDPAVCKLVHSCSEDVELLRHCFDLVPAGLLDSQIAVSLVSAETSVSYRQLVRHYLKISLPKDETRSDWLKRPLSEAQLNYAAQDVHYLLLCHELLCRELTALNRFDWALEDSRRAVARAARETSPELAYLELKGAWRLAPASLARLKRLCAWRERKARGRDLPRGHVVSNDSLFLLVQQRPDSVAALRRMGGLRGRQARLFGDELLALLAEEAPDDPELLSPDPPLSRVQGRRLRQLRELVRTHAKGLGIAPEVLARKKDLEILARDRTAAAEVLAGWRWRELGPRLAAAEGV